MKELFVILRLYLRRDILNSDHHQFKGSFEACCQEASIPPTLQSFVSYLMHGSTDTPGNNEYYKQAAMSICQLITFNTLIRTRKESSSSYHSVNREPALCVYLAMMIHSETRSLDMVETVSKLGLCISKHRLADLSIAMGNNVIDLNNTEGVVIPIVLKKGIFSTASIDNIDIDTTAALCTTSLHGTAASINQHPTEINQGTQREVPVILKKSESLKELPIWYTEVSPFHLPNEMITPEFKVPSKAVHYQKDDTLGEKRWLEDPDRCSWAVHHSKGREPAPHKDTSAMIPILRDDSKSPATIKHLLNILMQSINFLNPGQAAVIGLDQPLYALAKKIQWHQPSLYGEKKLVVMLGGLHIEMVMLSCIGDWLEDSGWTIALANSGVTTAGNDSLLTGHKVAKTKYAHQVTAMALHQLMETAYQNCPLKIKKSFQNWRSDMEKANPQFSFWSIALKMEMDYLMFLRSIRSSNFGLYVSSIAKFLPWILFLIMCIMLVGSPFITMTWRF